MTTFAADHDTDRQLRELDDRARTAWEDYRSSTSELAGPEYEDAELISWERLQHELHELANERQRLVGAAAGDAGGDASA
jgi:hypothetical protein